MWWDYVEGKKLGYNQEILQNCVVSGNIRTYPVVRHWKYIGVGWGGGGGGVEWNSCGVKNWGAQTEQPSVRGRNIFWHNSLTRVQNMIVCFSEVSNIFVVVV